MMIKEIVIVSGKIGIQRQMRIEMRMRTSGKGWMTSCAQEHEYISWNGSLEKNMHLPQNTGFIHQSPLDGAQMIPSTRFYTPRGFIPKHGFICQTSWYSEGSGAMSMANSSARSQQDGQERKKGWVREYPSVCLSRRTGGPPFSARAASAIWPRIEKHSVPKKEPLTG